VLSVNRLSSHSISISMQNRKRKGNSSPGSSDLPIQPIPSGAAAGHRRKPKESSFLADLIRITGKSVTIICFLSVGYWIVKVANIFYFNRTKSVIFSICFVGSSLSINHSFSFFLSLGSGFFFSFGDDKAKPGNPKL
jgi:hypothetical protein